MKLVNMRSLLSAALLAAGIAAVALVQVSARAASPPAREPLETRVQRIEDRAEIERLLMEYGRSLDNRDFVTYSNLFASNGEWTGSLGTYRGPAAIQAAMQKSFATAADIPKGTNYHLLTNAIIDINGDRATAESKWAFVMLEEKKPPQIAFAGRYEDTLIRENGQWKFLRRVAKAAREVAVAAPGSTPAR